MENVLLQMVPPPLPRSPAPEAIQCPELDLSLALTPERTGLSAEMLKRGKTMTHPRQVRFAVSPDQPPDTVVITQHDRNQSATKIQHCEEKQVSHTGEQEDTSANSDGRLIEGVELNTTLSLKAALQQLENEEFNSQNAVQERLQNSTVQECVRNRVAEGLNFPLCHHLYQSLISVNLSRDELITEVLRDRPALSPATVSHHTKTSSPPAETPDLLFFYEPHYVVREMPVLPGNHIPELRPCPASWPAEMTFHLLQKHRQWDS